MDSDGSGGRQARNSGCRGSAGDFKSGEPIGRDRTSQDRSGMRERGMRSTRGDETRDTAR